MRRTRRGLPLAAWLSPVAAMWVMLWFGINTGPGRLGGSPRGLIESLHWLRTAFPLFVPLPALLYIARAPSGDRTSSMPLPLKLWLGYGIVFVISSALSTDPFEAGYWGVAYVASVLATAAFMSQGDPLEGTARANYLGWAVNTAFLLTMLFMAREAVFVEETGYGVIGRQPEVVGMPMSRSSGLARFAATPAIVAFAVVLEGKSWRRIVGLAVFLPLAVFIYYLQSRGAIFALAGAMIACLILSGSRWWITLSVAAALCVLLYASSGSLNEFWMHITRGEGAESFRHMTGRTRTWRAGWEAFWKAPFIGRGGQAARRFDIGCIHNTYLKALLQGGIIGAGFFVAGLVLSCWKVVRLWLSGLPGKLGEKRRFVQVGGILAFFALRGIPEISGSMFNVDLMLMLPAVAYLWVLSRRGEGLSGNRRRGGA